MDVVSWSLVALSVLSVLMLLWLVLRRDAAQALRDEFRGAYQDHAQRLTNELREEVGRSAQSVRQELGATIGVFQQTLLHQQGDVARTQNEQIDSFRTQLAAMQQAIGQALQAATVGMAQQGQSGRDALDAALRRHAESTALAQQRFGETTNEQLRAVALANERALAEVRATVEQRLEALQTGNEHKLEQMRATVDEKLQSTLEQRLGESFRQVADRLEQVHRGLGEMQLLAKDVGSLNRVLSNVKTRGIFGEVQLAGLLEQVLTPEQYGRNVETVPGSGARVEFAIKLPGRREDERPLWLPIDAKFPREDYERLVDALERADAVAAEAAGRAVEQRLRSEARTIRDKYVAPPHTTEFAILFLPTEGLYAEALRRPGLMESLQREYRVTLTGPTTLLATLNSLQMGFRTLALERRSAEVWEVLGAVKTEFAKFGDVLAKTKKKLDEASSTIEQAQTRTRAMARSLRSVEGLSPQRTEELLPGAEADVAEDESA
jgi:DNA recombination protein RmuC